jgi:lipopolysaccharide biosynthesis glycosyltransferase
VNNIIHQIAISPDDNYADQGLTMLHSLVIHHPNQSFFIHVLDGGITKRQRLKYILFFLRYRVRYKFYKVSNELFTKAPVSLHISKAAYNRLLLSSIIPSNIDKILYLDCDIIINANIDELFEININKNALAAVEEIISVDHQNLLNFSNNQDYFNSGVLLLNLFFWREQKVEKLFFTFLEKQYDKIKYWDQDVLNYCFKNNWKKLDPKYNVTHFYFYKDVYSPEYFGISHDDYSEIISNPKIIHFTSHKKPWIEGCDHPLAYLYFKNELSLKKLIIDILLCRKR